MEGLNLETCVNTLTEHGIAGHYAICLFLFWLKIAHYGPPVDHPVLGAEPVEPQPRV